MACEDLCQLIRLVADEVLDRAFLFLDILLLRSVLRHNRCGFQRKLVELRIVEDSQQRIVIFRWNRIEFMVVALSASYSKAQKSPRRHIDSIILKFWAQRIKPESGRVFRLIWKQVPRNLRFYEHVVRHVLIEGP